MANTGYILPQSAESVSESPYNNADGAWATPTAIYGAGSASITSNNWDSGELSHVLKAYNFDLSSIPTGSTIDGVMCRVVASCTASSTMNITLAQLLSTTRVKGGTNMASTPIQITPQAGATLTIGANNNNWGNSLTLAWVQDADFGVAIGVTSGTNNADVSIDSIEIDVYYTAPANVLAETGAFTLTGKDVAFSTTRRLNAEVAAFTLTGQDVILNIPPTVALNTADANSFGNDTTPTLQFTGTDAQSDDITYRLQIDTANTFDSQSTINLQDDFSDNDYTNNPTWTPLTAGDWTISTAVANDILGEDNDYALLCTGVGDEIHADCTQAYGVWEIDWRSENMGNGDRYIKIVTTGTAITSDGYVLIISWDGDWNFRRYYNSGASFTILMSGALDFITDVWYRIKIVRNSVENEFVSGAKGTFAIYTKSGSGSYSLLPSDVAGSNPSTADDYYTSGSYFGLITENANERFSNILVQSGSGGALIDTYSAVDTADFVRSGDSDPFTSGGQVDYTVPAGSALTGGTYYWRVRGKDPSGSNSWGAWATTRSFTVTLLKEVIAEKQTYVLTGKDVGLTAGRRLDAEAGTFTLTGKDAAFAKGYQFTCEKGTFTFTGNDVILKADRKLNTEVQTYTLTGKDASLLAQHTLSAEKQTYTFTGNDVAFKVDRKLNAEVQSYTLTGKDATLTIARYLLAEKQTYTLTGNDVTLRSGKTFIAESQAYTLSGKDVAFFTNRVLQTEVQTYILTGNDVGLTKTGVTSFTAETGVFTLSGKDAIVTAGRLLSAEKQTYVLSGKDISVKTDRVLNAEKQTYTFTGKDVSFSRTYRLDAEKQTYTLTLNDAQISKVGMYSLDAESQSYTLTGNDVQFRYFSMPAVVGEFILVGKPVDFNSNKSVDAEKAAFTLSGKDVTFLTGRKLNAEKQTYTLTGNDAKVGRGLFINGEKQTYTVTYKDATFKPGRAIVATKQTYVVSGKDADLVYYGLNTDLIAESGSFRITGKTVQMGLPSILYYRMNNQWINLGKFTN